MARKAKPSVIDLFAGVGGLSLGAARAGFDVRAAVEIDAKALKAHHRNFPNAIPLDLDVGSLTGSSLLNSAGLKKGELAGLIGSPPCQGFSTIGRRKVDDQRNNLFGDFFRLVKETKPTFFLAENVPGILQDQYAALVTEALAVVGSSYELYGPLTLTAGDYGAPTSRRRVFFIGVKRNYLYTPTIASLTRGRKAKSVFVRQALCGLPGGIEDDWRLNVRGEARLRSVQETPFLRCLMDARPLNVGDSEAVRLLEERRIVLGHQGTLHSAELKERYALLGPGETDPVTKSRRLEGYGLCPTLRAGTGRDKGAFQAVRPIHHKHARVITPREAARLQSFPDWFVFDDTKWHSFRQIGNSVPPLLAEAVLRNIRTSLRL